MLPSCHTHAFFSSLLEVFPHLNPAMLAWVASWFADAALAAGGGAVPDVVATEPSSPLSIIDAAVAHATAVTAKCGTDMAAIEEELGDARELLEDVTAQEQELQATSNTLSMELHDGWLHRSVYAVEQPAAYAEKLAAGVVSPLWDPLEGGADALAATYRALCGHRLYLATHMHAVFLALTAKREHLDERIFKLRLKLLRTHELHNSNVLRLAAHRAEAAAAAAALPNAEGSPSTTTLAGAPPA